MPFFLFSYYSTYVRKKMIFMELGWILNKYRKNTKHEKSIWLNKWAQGYPAERAHYFIICWKGWLPVNNVLEIRTSTEFTYSATTTRSTNQAHKVELKSRKGFFVVFLFFGKGFSFHKYFFYTQLRGRDKKSCFDVQLNFSRMGFYMPCVINRNNDLFT